MKYSRNNSFYVKSKDIIKMAKNHLTILTQMCIES